MKRRSLGRLQSVLIVSMLASCARDTPSAASSAGPVCQNSSQGSPGPGGASTAANFVTISSGSFTMGAPSSESCYQPDEAQYHVTLTHSFLMQATDVTQGQWQSLMGNNPSAFSGSSRPVDQVNWWDAASYANALSATQSLAACYTLSGCTGTAGGKNLSCTGVTINSSDGTPYTCTGYRLPTEAEWEYAYRAGTTTAYYDGPNNSVCYSNGDDPNLDSIAWYDQNDGTTTEPVGGKAANPWGLYDMSGNAWQWVWDWYGSYPAGSVINPAGPATGSARVRRGGSYGNDPGYVRAASRWSNVPSYIYAGIGFRLVRSVD